MAVPDLGLSTLRERAYRARVGGPDTGVELIADIEQIRERLDELSFYTSTSVYSVQPTSRPSPDAAAAARPLEMRSLRRGIDIRMIYDDTAVADERRRARLHDAVAGGVRVRLGQGPLQRLIIMDENVAVVAADPTGADPAALIVRQPGLLDGFVRLFHLLWATTTELKADQNEPDDVLTEDERVLLALLSSGATDEAAARDFGISERQVRRRVAVLMRRLGARSRFEAGVLAVRRGWI